MRHHLGLFVAAAASVVGLLLLTGCLSTNPGSSSLAYVNIASRDAEAIWTETLRVFADDNYRFASETAGELIFEREATRRDRVLLGTYVDKQMVMRVVVSIEPRSQGGYLLRADAYKVRNGFAEKLPRMMRGHYQNLLNRVKASLVSATRN